VAATIEIGLIGSGDIEGALVKSDGSGLEGLDVELLDVAGKVVATARSDYDGFFLLERIAYGRYTLRLSADSAKAAHVEAVINRTIDISAEKTVVRLGAIHVEKSQHIALAEPAGGMTQAAR
jgi:hypothetical protein